VATVTAGQDALDAREAERAVAAPAGRAANVVARVQTQLRAGRNVAEVGLDQRRMLVQTYNGQAYNYIDGFLIDQRLRDDTEVTYVQFGSDAYFELVRNRADVRPALAANLNTVVQLDVTHAVAIVDGEGETVQTEFTDAQRAAFFGG
jgi:hypothetical protein